jgi:hypothetical protein
VRQNESLWIAEQPSSPAAVEAIGGGLGLGLSAIAENLG